MVIVNGVLCVSHFEIFTVIPAYKTLSITNSFRRNFWCQSSRTVTESNPPQNLFKKQQIKTHINSHMKKSTDISCQFSSTQDWHSVIFDLWPSKASSPVHADIHIKLVQIYRACCSSPFPQALRSNSSDFHGLTQFPPTGSWPDHRGVQLHWLLPSGSYLCNGYFQPLLPTDTVI